ncbi:hypothetical protein HNV11_14350 [Spirosoma taeanense]|uniref:Uncharacterized protein n=1 Tax=Spirosoma taeanense TaxID=2735870 RepID=A0A6M5Y907_9BACT|nr:hypothetical protein [Spirosoma taeanense]QJW90475.1 hypothetical protein HNV11_14350 [Spirosoma taeanense]
MRRYAFLILLGILYERTQAQEFPRGFSLPIELGQGFNQPVGSPPLYLLTLQVVPQVTLIEKRLRLGAVLGGFYPGARVGGLAGPRLTLKLLEGPPILSATSFNLHLLGEFLWATAPALEGGRQLLGGGIGLGSSDLVTVAFKLHRDLNQPATWFQVSIGYNIAKPKIPSL